MKVSNIKSLFNGLSLREKSHSKMHKRTVYLALSKWKMSSLPKRNRRGDARARQAKRLMSSLINLTKRRVL